MRYKYESGFFTKVRIDTEENIVKGYTCCPLKECTHVFIDSPYFPKYNVFEIAEDYEVNMFDGFFGDMTVYKFEMPRYEGLSKLNEQGKETYKGLVALDHKSVIGANELAREVMKFDFPSEFKEDLISAIYDLGNYDYDLSFDISTSNIKSLNGDIILLDAICSREYLRKTSDIKTRRLSQTYKGAWDV